MDVTCPADLDDPFKCHTKDEYLQQLMALLPRGRAWQSHEDGIVKSLERYPGINAECGEAECGEAECGQPALVIDRTVMAAYWAAYAEVLEYMARRACDLLDEFYCDTAHETLVDWGADYGFPDPCEPWNDLCEKVAARGGATCEYLVWAAARRGWVIECRDCQYGPSAAMAGCSQAGNAQLCAPACDPYTLTITIKTADSPAYTTRSYPPLAGRASAGCTTLCSPSWQEVRCLIERVKPAHVQANYVIQ